MGIPVKSGRSFYTYARIPIATATQELQALAEREYEEVGQKDLERLNIDWARYGELDAAGKLATFIAKRDGVIVGYAAFIVQTHIHYQDALVAANSAVYVVPEVRAGRVVLKLLRFAELGLKAQGVQKIYYHVKQTKDFGRLLGHLGYQDVERMYAKVVQDREDAYWQASLLEPSLDRWCPRPWVSWWPMPYLAWSLSRASRL